MARERKNNGPEWERRSGETFSDYMDRMDALLREALEQTRALPDGEVVGAVLRFPCADGYALYRVVGDSPLTVEHLPVGDAWTVHPALIRGLRKPDVLAQIQRVKHPLFGFGPPR